MGRTIAERLRGEAARSFVGRGRELGLIEHALAADALPFLVAYVHGPGGVGKSRLVHAAAERLPDGDGSIVLDCQQVEPTPRGFLRAVAAGLDDERSEPAIGDVADLLGSGGRRMLLVLDTYEAFGLLDGWLRNTFLPSLPDSVLTIMASRNAPSPAWLTTPGWEGLFRELQLDDLPADEAREMLLRRALDEDDVERVLRVARGHPLALELGAAAVRADPDLRIVSGPPREILEQLSSAFLAGLPEPVAEAAEAGSALRRITHPLLQEVLGRPLEDDVFDELRHLPFVRTTVEGLAIHDVVRDTISADVARRDPERLRRYRRRAWRFLTRMSTTVSSLHLWQHTADLLFLFQNPYIREAFFPAGANEVSVERAAPEDEAGILGIVAATAPGELALLRGWWDVQPEAFHVARDVRGDVAGFHILAEAADLHPEVLRGDPVARAYLEHLRRVPIDEGERALLFRRWLTRGIGEQPSPSQAACWLDVKRTYMELRPHLRRLYTSVVDLAGYAPTVGPLGFRPIPDADVEVGGVTLHCAMLDFGEGSVDGWLRGLIGAELGAEVDPDRDGPALPEGTVTILFTDIADSTRLTNELGDGRFRMLARRLDGGVRAAVSESGGVPVDGLLLGDGLMAVFNSATNALDGAIRARAAADEVGLGLRVGLHAGEVLREGGNVFGGAVNLAARVASVASPGDVLASQTVVELARTSAPVEFEDRGRFALKGFEDERRLFAVRARDASGMVATT